MQRVNLEIHVIPSGVHPELLETYNPIRDGKELSTTKKINVNKSSIGYSLVYESDEFINVQYPLLMSNLVKIFKQNIPDSIVYISLHYDYETGESAYFDLLTYQKINELGTLCSNIIKTKRVDNLEYVLSESMMEADDYYHYMNDEEDDLDKVEGEEPYPDPLNGWEDPYGIMRDIRDSEEYDEYDDEYDYRKGNKKKYKSYISYGESRSWRHAKSPKRSIRRHGVIIADNKDDIRKDEKILKSFLEEFIPGDSKWEKEFRKDVLKRWLNMYVISKKNLKKAERNYRKHKRKLKSVDMGKAMNITRKMMGMNIDSWNDPSK